MKTPSFTQADREALAARGLSEEQATEQLRILQQGVPYLTLDRPCTIDDGIIRLSPDTIRECIARYEREAPRRDITKFTPASGAATRMFQDLIRMEKDDAFVEPDWIQKKADKGDAASKALVTFMANLDKFAFYEALSVLSAHEGIPLSRLRDRSHHLRILRYLLHPVGLNYSRRPKGLILFHHAPEGPRTAFEEHLVEAAHYARGRSDICRLHFTVSMDHQPRFEALFNHVRQGYESRLGVRFDLHFSNQKSSTDTLALDLSGNPFRQDDGSLLFRPGGHGALLDNLNRLKGDIVFIKNIDNVVPDPLKPPTTRFKKALAGLLLTLQADTFRWLKLLSVPGPPTMADEAMEFAQSCLNIKIPEAIRRASPSHRRTWIIDRLHRPLRVCGVVENHGEAGGGPFWVGQDECPSLQIVEASSVDPSSSRQQEYLKSATHFNPVDLVLGLRDFQGRAFDLTQFTDPEAVFISSKTKAGRDLKALEHPGLWNGGMARWNTVFVEVPPETFAPVKTVLDLLRDEHRSTPAYQDPSRPWDLYGGAACGQRPPATTPPDGEPPS
ncbi:DUF4301 family protein [Desulfoluna butyratoxydans]|uniref:Nucleotide-diphospho-sugar transferases n=1 Tax=Desulfoluna butyratoxydans TaxID=231438 RepID=A0A4U8YI07_9BACT|nr:DUF4301 family protein [Desulfoluna butyratoxydans]VFQ42950.1 nucleotide-diphospho-sugar transferases [Desulfoluna butyratoxydans]